ncbi:MAG: UDP-N-acetylmuramoyl-tripeptide--D-alanyl-D-alanine ligase [Acidobacteriota bacterium]|nr:MAG: UDP-N-acetylmuramoyl-tripeptide--D-alanyl-D-alanine ligase [Acidobacteriota bacterium]
MKLTARDIARFTCGKLVSGSAESVDSVISAVSIDTRTIERGDLFVAIRGPHRDGHDYVANALESGAAGIVVSQLIEIAGSAFQVQVKDTTRALQDLAQVVRERAGVRVVAITGSMGKTTTKEAAAAAMGSCRRVLKTKENLNNLYGLPLTLLELGELGEEDVAVVEMGMSEPGEITRLTEIAKPDVGVLTNVAEVHLEFFDSISEIADAKGELLLGLAGDAVAVVNADDPLVLEQARKFAGRQIRFGLAPSADLRACQIRSTSAGVHFRAEDGGRSVEVTSSLHGRHNVYNLLAGLAAARALDVPLEEAASGLASLSPPRHRGERIALRGDILLIDETYNSNPRALICALDALVDEDEGRRVAVVGDMLELGPRASELHREVGRHAATLELGLLVGVGRLGREIVAGARVAGMAEARLAICADAAAAGTFLERSLVEGDVVLVKGSRGVGLDETIELTKRALSEGES